MGLIRVHHRDNVAVASRDLEPGERIDLPWGGQLTAREKIPRSHKVSLRDLAAGEGIYRYGQPIGVAGQAIPQGGWVHTHNLRAPEGIPPQGPAPGDDPVGGPEGPDTFPGYSRPKGPAGIRNHLLVLPTVACANGVVRAVGRALPQAVTLEHAHGCGRRGEDGERTLRVLSGCGTHPNVGAVLLVGLGCEAVRGDGLAEQIQASGRPVKYIEIQTSGGSRRSAETGIQLALSLWEEISSQVREPHPLSELSVGLQCGGSDALSGITANPTVGRVSDWVVARGGTVMLAETTEMIGTLHLLEARAEDSGVAEAIRAMISKQEDLSRRILGERAHLVIAPGNMDGGLSSIMEKSLGCIAKGGSTPIRDVVDYAQRSARGGLILMDTPGYDVESLGGLVGAGCQVILFTTGRGTPVGTPMAPVIKVASNSDVWRRMEDDLDVNAGVIADGDQGLREVSLHLWGYLMDVLGGKATRAEENDQGVLALSMTMEAF